MNEPEQEPLFSDETIEALKEFGEVLQRIHNRLIKEGKTIEIDEHYRTEKKPRG